MAAKGIRGKLDSNTPWAEHSGWVFGEWMNEQDGRPKPALLGSLVSAAKTLEELGGPWDQAERVDLFAAWPMLGAAFQHVAVGRETSRPGIAVQEGCWDGQPT